MIVPRAVMALLLYGLWVAKVRGYVSRALEFRAGHVNRGLWLREARVGMESVRFFFRQWVCLTNAATGGVAV